MAEGGADQPVDGARAPVLLRKAFHPGGKFIAFSTSDGCFVANIETKELLKGPGTRAGAIAFNDDYIAIAGDGSDARFPPHHMVMWKLSTNTHVAELQFRADILNIVMNSAYFAVVTANQVHVYSFPAGATQPQHVQVIETGPNPLGLCQLSTFRDNTLIAYPGEAVGSVQIDDLESRRRGNPIAAHSNALSCMTLSNDNSLLVTASVVGTLVRVFKAATGEVVRELRRGMEHSSVQSLAFSPDNKSIVLASEKAAAVSSTIHIFSLADDTHKNSRSFLYNVGSYFSLPMPSVISGEWSFAQFHTDEAGCVAAFRGNSENITVISSSGKVFHCVIDDLVPNKCREMQMFTLVPDRAS